MSDFIVGEEGFRFGILDKVPVPNKNECILLYRERSGENGSIVLNEGTRMISSDVRRGKFNRKITVSMGNRSVTQNVKVGIKDMEMYFDVTIQISYRIANVKEFYFRGRVQENEVKQCICKAVKKYNNKFELKKGIDLEESIREGIEQSFQQYESLKFELLKVSVSPDEDAKNYIESDKEKARVIHELTNKTDTNIFLNKQKEREMSSEDGIYLKKLKKIMAMTQEFGHLAPLVDGYIEGKMDGKELYDYTMENRGKYIEDLIKIVDKELLTHEEAIDRVGNILDDGKSKMLNASRVCETFSVK